MIYITGDTHGDFSRVERFCRRLKTTKEDVLIILGDACINYYGHDKDIPRKEELSQLPVTLFCIHGNHERRPFTIDSYKEQIWHGGTVYMEEAFPSLIFAKDGEIYDLGGLQTIVIGGAYSVDKEFRLAHNYGWWPDEQPSAEIKADVQKALDQAGWKIDVVLSHTVPSKYQPTEVFLRGLDQAAVDKSTEEWLGRIEEKLNYRQWYAGHFHTSKRVDKLRIMYKDFRLFSDKV